MSHSIICDGCGCPVPEGQETIEGMRSKVEYCPVCAARYKTWEEAIFARQASMAREFEAFLKANRESLKAGGLKELPDDPEG